jgi:hypothetical protein
MINELEHLKNFKLKIEKAKKESKERLDKMSKNELIELKATAKRFQKKVQSSI